MGMKQNLEDRNHVLYQAMGEIDSDILHQVDNMQENPIKPKVNAKQNAKKRVFWGAVACLCIMGAASNGLVRYVVGGRIQLKEDGTGYSGSFTSLEGKVYSEQDGVLYYNLEKDIFSKNKEEITDFCSETDYYFLPQLDEGGSGYVIAVGGTEGNRGHILAHYERGELMLLRGELDRTTYSEIFQIDANPYKEIWARHFVEFLGKDGHISPQFWGSDLGEGLMTDYGTAKKVTELGYWVEGYEVAPLTMREAVAVGMLEMQSVEGYTGGGASFDCPDWDNPYDFSLNFSLTSDQEGSPIDLEATHDILSSLCDTYILRVEWIDIEIIGNSHYHTPRTIYEVVVSPEGREVTMSGEFSWMEG